MTEWHLVTGEYPPQPGGVSDYTYLLACALAADGDLVHVWCPGEGGAQESPSGVVVHRSLGSLTPSDLRRASAELDRFPAPRRIVVQWVPHAYGLKAMNVPFCAWLAARRVGSGDLIEVMAHETCLEFAGSWRQRAAAAVHRGMLALLVLAARRIWVSVPAAANIWRRYTFGRAVPTEWLPVPSNVSVVHDPEGVQYLRSRFAASDGVVLGHFGTYGRLIADPLARVLLQVLRNDDRCTILLLGRGSEAMRDRLRVEAPEFGSRILAGGALPAREASLHLQACDLMLQPYQDGISARRGSAMAAISHGLPVVTTADWRTESLWAERRAVALVPAGDERALAELTLRLIGDSAERERLGAAAASLYEERFALRHTVAALRDGGAMAPRFAETNAAVSDAEPLLRLPGNP